MKNRNKILKRAILTAVIVLLSLIGANNVSLAYGVWQGNETSGRPQEGVYSPVGQLPQILRNRQFSGNADTQFPYGEWTTNISSGTVYCGNFGVAVRFGEIDPNIYYMDSANSNYSGLTYSDFEAKVKTRLYSLAIEKLSSLPASDGAIFDSIYYYNIGYNQIMGPTAEPGIYAIETNKPLISFAANGNTSVFQHMYAGAVQMAGQVTSKIFSKLNEWDKPTDTWDASTNADTPQAAWSGGSEFGPEVAVMETTAGAQDGYKISGGTHTAANNALAYILSSMTNAYSGATNSVHDKYSLADIQAAHWKLVDTDFYKDEAWVNGRAPNGRTLYNQAIAYANFANSYANGNSYSASIDGSQAQVIVNPSTQNYIIGPLSISYPYYDDVSYMKSLYIKTDEGTSNEKTLIYDDWHNDFSIECVGTTKSGSNGLTKVFPASGAQFYIKFSASKANYPEKVNVYADFEYLKSATAKYNDLTTNTNIYQYIGYVALFGPREIRRAWGYGDATYYYRSRRSYTTDESDYWGTDSQGNKLYSHYGTVSVSGPNEINILQPFVKMTSKPVRTINSQPQRVALDASRTYAVYSTSCKNGPFDLTIELGGRVWVDAKVGKENKSDGIFNSSTDKPMPNVKVSLYQVNGLDGNQSGQFIGAVTTDQNGQYKFTKLNAMRQYYVKFTYNGQYYQPTKYNVNRNDSNWNNTSKGLDILKDRDNFNAQFEEIRSTPRNSASANSDFLIRTRQELQNAGLIDEFGNIPGKLDTNGNRSSSDAYVNRSMMDSYTCNGTSTKDLYPGKGAFVIDNYLNNLTNTQKVLEFIGSKDVSVLYGNPDLMHSINQGYVLREKVDLALRKDVYKATLEINGKTQVYKYNKREGLETDANGNSYWEIQTRISDGYYNYEYSRELYREDYDYKIENYVMNGDTQTTLDNLGLSQDSELKIYVTYKYTIRNNSEGIAAKVTEIVDYYDEDYTFVADRSYIGDGNGNKQGEIGTYKTSKYGNTTETSLDRYNKIYIRGANGSDLPLSDPDVNKDVYLYITFIVNKATDENGNTNRNILDEVVANGDSKGVGKENIAEINGYKTYYGSKAEAPNTGNPQTQQEYTKGDIAGITDTNSTPGNLNPNDITKDGKINYENFENDTDKAPNIKIILNRENSRTVEGTVWEDARTETSGYASVGNGVRDNETGINGVRVQLIEVRDGKDGNKYEYIWKEVYSGNKEAIAPIINNSGIVGNYTIDSDNADGKYKFVSFVPGNYIVRFIYGSGESTVLGTTYTNYNTGEEDSNAVTDLYESDIPGYKKREGNSGYEISRENIGLNKNSYNGQDYKSTSYQVGVNNGTGAYENNSTTSFTYNFSEADSELYSDAKDIMNPKSANVINIAPNANYLIDCTNSRKQVEDYSKGDIINGSAEKLASYENLPEYNNNKYDVATMKSMLDEFMKRTYMISESGTIDVNFEYNRTFSDTSNDGGNNIGSSNYDKCGYYVLGNLDLGLEQRPKAQLKVTKQITNVKVTLANGSTLFDASNKATNVLWIPHDAHGQDKANTYKTNDNYINNIIKTPIVRQQSTNKGKVQLTMDEELMHGSTLQITYAITVANIGEADYNEDQFYYTGIVGNPDSIVKTNPRMLVDYVGTQVHDYGSGDDNSATRNNLQFDQQLNPDWTVISSDDLLNRGLLNRGLESNVKKYSDGHIIITEKTTADLIPIIADQDAAKTIKEAFDKDPLHALQTVNGTRSVRGVQLVLSQMITQDSDSDDRNYNNMAELVMTRNDVGRRMSYSVVGNQDPTVEPREIDADDSQEVVILPPFGQKYIYYALGIAVAVVLIAGISITIRMLKKKK